MKKFLLITIISIILTKPLSAVSQNNSGDTAAFPYWISMMQNPNENFYKTQRAFNLYWKDRKITKGCGWKVFKRWEYMMQSRVNPDGSIPKPEISLNSYEDFKSLNNSGGGAWVSLGPSTIPDPGPAGYEGLGRLNVIAFHPTDPNKLYTGAASGGFWYSTDGGANWATTTDDLPSLGISAILVDYSNPDVILIGTGDRDHGDAPGMGIYRSTDGGLTWLPSKTGMENLSAYCLIQDPVNPLVILAATSGGIFRSTDGGSTWTRSIVGDFKDLKFNPGNSSIVYAAANYSFFRSSDNGLTFAQITSGLPSGQRGVIGVSPANPSFVYFLISNTASGYLGLYRSADAGLSFTTRSTSPNILDWSCDGSGTGGQGWYDLALAVDPANAEIVYAGGIDVWKSADGGTTWAINSHWWGGCSVPAVHADCHYLAFSPLNGALFACNDGGLFGSPDNGNTWQFFSETMTIGQIYKLGLSATVRNKVINGFQDNGTYTYTGGGSWIQTGGGDGMECAVDAENAAYTFHTIYYGDIFRKYNNTSQSHIAGNGVNGITEDGGWITPFILSKTNHRRMFIGYKNIWRADDVLGDTISFTKISDNLSGNSVAMTAVEQSEADSNILYAMRGDRKLFRSDNCLDPNPTWTDLSSAWPDVLSGTSMEAHPTEPGTLYLTAGSNIYKSVTKGASWVNITGNLPFVHINHVVYYKNAAEGLYIGTDAGAYYKDQSTGGWVSFNNGLPACAKITELEIFYDNGSATLDAIRASTYGRGLWTSPTYDNPPSSVAKTESGSLKIFPNPSHGLIILVREQFTDASHLSVITAEGMVVYEQDFAACNRNVKETIDLSGLSKGVYVIRITSENFTRTGKLVVY